MKSGCGSVVDWIDLYVSNSRSLCVLWKTSLWKSGWACLAPAFTWTQAIEIHINSFSCFKKCWAPNKQWQSDFFFLLFFSAQQVPVIKNLLPANHSYVSYWHSCIGCKVCYKDLQSLREKKHDWTAVTQRRYFVCAKLHSFCGRIYRNNKLFDIVQPINRRGPLLCNGLAACYFVPVPQ